MSAKQKMHWPVGRTIVGVRPMDENELKKEWWSGEYPPTVIVLNDGSLVYPSRDDEGNGPGALFGAKGEDLLRI